MNPVPVGTGPLPGLVGWLATYALHSTLLLAVAALVAPRLRSEADPLRGAERATDPTRRPQTWRVDVPADGQANVTGALT